MRGAAADTPDKIALKNARSVDGHRGRFSPLDLLIAGTIAGGICALEEDEDERTVRLECHYELTKIEPCPGRFFSAAATQGVFTSSGAVALVRDLAVHSIRSVHSEATSDHRVWHPCNIP